VTPTTGTFIIGKEPQQLLLPTTFYHPQGATTEGSTPPPIVQKSQTNASNSTQAVTNLRNLHIMESIKAESIVSMIEAIIRNTHFLKANECAFDQKLDEKKFD
jgi:hypothetical protein